MRHAGQPKYYAIFFTDPKKPVPTESSFSPSSGVTFPTSDGTESGGPVESEGLVALRAAIDRAVDGSVWRNADRDALLELLASPDAAGKLPQVRTGVLPLLQQPDFYRSKQILMSGRIARGERIITSDPIHAIGSYWHLWLRPEDGTEQPVLMIVRELPAGIERLIPLVDQEVAERLMPRVDVAGVYLKRLAYRSSQGADLAPVLVGKITAIPVEAVQPPKSDPNSTDTASLPIPSWIFAITVLSGVVIAGGLMWRSAENAKRLRALRHTRQPEQLALETFSPHSPPTAFESKETSDDKTRGN
jgi:hypothetical protein